MARSDQGGTEPDHGALNVLDVGGRAYLLVDGMAVVHLAAEATEEHAERRGALEQHLLTSSGLDGGDPEWAALTNQRWAPRSLCGYRWSAMAPTGELASVGYDRPAAAPSCRSCIRLVSRSFPPPHPDERVARLAALVAETVTERGSAEVTGTPGDQCEALRRAIRAELRRSGYRSNTLVHGQHLIVISEDAWQARSENDKAAVDRLMAEALAATEFDMAPTGEPAWRFRWQDWERWA